MKALSIRQPWASLIMAGVKPVENRTWPSKYRGRLAIHAAKAWDNEGEKFILDQEEFFQNALGRIVEGAKNLRGGFLGSVNMIDCVKKHNSKWFFGPYGFVFEDPILTNFYPYKGQLSFFEAPIHWVDEFLKG